MFKKIIDFILSFFKKDNSSKKRVQSKIKNSGNKPHNKNGVKVVIIKKDNLLVKIEENLQFIDELIEALEEKGNYKSHIKKLKDMKVQSYGCTKLIKRTSEHAPYYQSTLKLINDHTNTVRELMQLV